MKSHLTTIALLGGIGLLHFPLAAGAQPVATTLAATSVTSSNATLNGTVNPNGAVAVGYFQYGLTTNYGNIGGFLALPATNTALTLPGLVVNALTGAAGANWTRASAPVLPYLAIASSADGTRLAAVANGGGIYVSTNSGSTWTLTSAPSEVWVSIASSADGTRLAAAIGQSSSGLIYVSTNSGVTWTLTSAPSRAGHPSLPPPMASGWRRSPKVTAFTLPQTVGSTGHRPAPPTPTGFPSPLLSMALGWRPRLTTFTPPRTAGPPGRRPAQPTASGIPSPPRPTG